MKAHTFINSWLCCCSLAVMLTGGLSVHGMDVERLIADIEGTVLVIEGVRQDGSTTQSSGCVVHTSGLILTTAHQAIDVDSLTARNSNGDVLTLSVVELDEQRELALLRAEHPLPAAARLGDANALRAGAALITLATPVNLDFSAATGIVSSHNRTYRGFPVIQAEITAAPGSSGAPVFNRHGEMVGLIMGMLEEQTWATIIIPINNAYSMLGAHGVYHTTLPAETHEQALAPVSGISPVELRALEAYNNGTQASNNADRKTYYGRAVELLPEFYEAWFNLGVAATRTNDLAEATGAYRRAIALRPDSIEARRNLGRLYMGKESYDAAARVFEEVRQLRPDTPQSYNDLGEAHRNAGAYELAIEAFQQALALDATYANALYNLAITYIQTDAWEAAHGAFERYLDVAPEAKDREQVASWLAAIDQQMRP